VELVLRVPMGEASIVKIAVQTTGVQQSLFLRFAWV